MGIINRTLDESQKQQDVAIHLEDTVTAVSDQVYICPHDFEIQSAKAAAEGLSGAPTAQLQIQRFVVGAGETQLALGPALTLVSVGTSGLQSFTFSLTSLQAGDQVRVVHAGTNAAVTHLDIGLVVKPLQDIKSWDY